MAGGNICHFLLKLHFYLLFLFNIGGYHKTTHKIIKTVIALSIFMQKIKSNREYIIRKL